MSINCENMLKIVYIFVFSIMAVGADLNEDMEEISNRTIVGKENATYYAHILADGQVRCGGAILTPKFILTSALCFEEVCTYSVITGESSFLNDTKAVPISKRIIHEYYNNVTNDHNIALIELEKELEMCSYRTTIPIGNVRPAANSRMSVVGYTHTDVRYDLTVYIMKNTIQKIDNSFCSKFMSYYFVRDKTENEFCVYNHFNALASTPGGPAVFQDQLVGLVAYFPHQYCGINSDVCVVLYTDVLSYRCWINDKTGIDLYDWRHADF